MNHFQYTCEQFAKILKGKSDVQGSACNVNFQRKLDVYVQGKPAKSVVHAGVTFESLDASGNALNLGEFAVLEEEIPAFMHALVSQGLIVSALHNHWLFTKPTILYLHVQSVEPPLNFAKKIAYAFTFLKEYPSSSS